MISFIGMFFLLYLVAGFDGVPVTGYSVAGFDNVDRDRKVGTPALTARLRMGVTLLDRENSIIAR